MSDQRTGSEESIRFPLVPVWVRGVLVVCVLGVLLYYSIVPPPRSGLLDIPPLDAIPYHVWLHLFGYMGLAVILAYATVDVDRPRSQVLVGVFLIVITIGAVIEGLQYTLQTRTFSLLDIIVNVVGTVVGVLAWAVVHQKIRFYRLTQPDG